MEGLFTQAVFSHFPAIIAQSGLRQAKKFLGADSGQMFNRGLASLVGKYFKIDTSKFLHPERWVASRADIDTTAKNSNFMNNIVRIDKEQVVGEKVKNQMATRSIGGWALTFLLFALTASSSSLFDERKSGVMLRILTSPVSRVHILWSKYLYNMSLAIVATPLHVRHGLADVPGRYPLQFPQPDADNHLGVGRVHVIRHAARRVLEDKTAGKRAWHVIDPDHERNRRGVVPDVPHAVCDPVFQQADVRLFGPWMDLSKFSGEELGLSISCRI